MARRKEKPEFRTEPLTALELAKFNILKKLSGKELARRVPAWARTAPPPRAAEFTPGQAPRYPAFTHKQPMAPQEFKFPDPHKFQKTAEYIKEFHWLNMLKIPRISQKTLAAFHRYGGRSDYREILPDDVGKPTIKAFGHRWRVDDFLGQILPQDIGKRIYLRGDVLQVENNEQRNARLGLRKNPRELSVPEKHQLKIARQTLKYSDAGARIMGGMTKEEAREILKRHGDRILYDVIKGKKNPHEKIYKVQTWNGTEWVTRHAYSTEVHPKTAKSLAFGGAHVFAKIEKVKARVVLAK